jgi:hypothetical protein
MTSIINFREVTTFGVITTGVTTARVTSTARVHVRCLGDLRGLDSCHCPGRCSRCRCRRCCPDHRHHLGSHLPPPPGPGPLRRPPPPPSLPGGPPLAGARLGLLAWSLAQLRVSVMQCG